jgi:uncharacterized protein YbaP (TraB family)
MKRIVPILTLIVICLAGKLSAQYAPYTGNNKSLLWKISSKEMKQPSYLFGTIHLICPGDYVWTPAMQRALASSKEVCFEMDMDDPGVMMQVAASMGNNGGKKLSEYYNDLQYKKVLSFFSDSIGISPAMVEQLRPVALQTIATARLVNCPVPVSYETNILTEAQKGDKYITGLEEVSEQAMLLTSIPEETVIKDLNDIMANYTSKRMEYQQLVNLYKKQDLPALYETIQQSVTTEDNIDAFLNNRNAKWISSMIEKMDQQPVFFAVGAGHLWGENGLISLLRNAGYTVTPVKK